MVPCGCLQYVVCLWNSFLLPSLLTPLWNNSVKIFQQVTKQDSHQEGFMVFCQRLLYTLQVGPSPIVSYMRTVFEALGVRVVLWWEGRSFDLSCTPVWSWDIELQLHILLQPLGSGGSICSPFRDFTVHILFIICPWTIFKGPFVVLYVSV